MLKLPGWLKRLVGQDPSRAANGSSSSPDPAISKPSDTDAPAIEETYRSTVVEYIDPNGDKGTLEIPGWVGAARPFIEANIEFSDILGQAYVERPYLTRENAPTELTVADLRSADGMARMLQEFAGQIHTKSEIIRLVDRRLGADTGKWQIVGSIVLKRATRH